MMTKPLRKNDANYCRLKGWQPGDVLTIRNSVETNMRYGARFVSRDRAQKIKITAIGEESILVRRIYESGGCSSEERWARRLLKYVVERPPAAVGS